MFFLLKALPQMIFYKVYCFLMTLHKSKTILIYFSKTYNDIVIRRILMNKKQIEKFINNFIRKTSFLSLGLISIFFHKTIPLLLLANGFLSFKRETLSKNNIFSPSFLFWLSLSFYSILSLLWSVDPWSCGGKFLQTTSLCLAGFFLYKGDILGLRIPFLGGWILGALFFMIDFHCYGEIYKFLHSSYKIFSLSIFNKGMTVLSFLFWPFMGILGSLWITKQKLSLLTDLLFLGFFMGICYKSQSETTTLAMVLASLGYFIFRLFPTVAGFLIRGGILTAFGLIPFLPTLFSYLQTFPFLANLPSLIHRFLIWDFFLKLSWNKPLLGWGFNGAHVFCHEQIYINKFQLTALHPHHVPLQIWMELGLVGVGLFLWGIHLLLKSIEKNKNLSERARAILLSQIVMIFIISNAAYGAWQAWWVASLWIAAFCNRIFIDFDQKNLLKRR